MVAVSTLGRQLGTCRPLQHRSAPSDVCLSRCLVGARRGVSGTNGWVSGSLVNGLIFSVRHLVLVTIPGLGCARALGRAFPVFLHEGPRRGGVVFVHGSVVAIGLPPVPAVVVDQRVSLLDVLVTLHQVKSIKI